MKTIIVVNIILFGCMTLKTDYGDCGCNVNDEVYNSLFKFIDTTTILDTSSNDIVTRYPILYICYRDNQTAHSVILNYNDTLIYGNKRLIVNDRAYMKLKIRVIDNCDSIYIETR